MVALHLLHEETARSSSKKTAAAGNKINYMAQLCILM